MIEEKKIYPWIDVTKLICALLIVFMHSYCCDLEGGEWIRDTISTIGVPFFFIASGFFYEKGLERVADRKQYFIRYLKRILMMYLIWTVITLPVSWWNISRGHTDYSSLLKTIYLFRTILFSGTLGIYWYILSLIINSVILYFVFTKRWELFLYVFALVFFMIGLLYDAGLLDNTALYELIHIVFGSERNFLNVGLFYMSVGDYIAKKEINGKIFTFSLMLVVCIVLDSILQSIISVQFMQAFSAFALFNLAKNITVPLNKNLSMKMRKLSTAIYLTHFPVILVFDYYLNKGTIIDFSFTLVFSIVLYEVLNRLLPQKYTQVMYGN